MMWRKMFGVPEIKLESQAHSQGLGHSSRRVQLLAKQNNIGPQDQAPRQSVRDFKKGSRMSLIHTAQDSHVISS